jgi:hypothetical protein
MKFIDKFVIKLESAFQRNRAHRTHRDPEVLRQNTPPDEGDAEVAEANSEMEAAQEQSEAAEQEHGLFKNLKARAKKAGSKS